MENNVPNLNSVSGEMINIRELISKYLNKWYWFVISALVCLFVAFIYLKVTNTQYQVQTTILLRKDQSTKGLLDMSMLEGLGGSGSSKEVEDELQVLTSKSLMSHVIRSLGVETEYYVRKGLRYEEQYPISPLKLNLPPLFNDTLKQPIVFVIKKSGVGYSVQFNWDKIEEEYKIADFSKPISTPAGLIKFSQITPIKDGEKLKIVTSPIRNLTDTYSTSIKVMSANKKSNAINISTTTANTNKAVDMLNKLVDYYNEDAVLDKNMIAENTANFVQDRLLLIGSELREVELNVEDYKKKNKLTDLSSEAELFLKSSGEYDVKLAALETQLNLVGYIESYVKDNKNQYNLVPANLGIDDKSLLTLMQEYNQALLSRMRVERTTNTNNPVMVQMEQQLKIMRSAIVASIVSIKDGIKISKNDVMGKRNQFAGRIKEVPTQERQFLEIKRQQEIKEKLYLFLLQKREENALSLASTIPSAKTVDGAYASILPVAPRRMIILLIALIIGMALPVVVIYLIDLLNNKINDRAELKKLIKAPFLGSVGVSKENDAFVVREGKTTPIVEMFRILRTNLQFMLSGKSNPVVLVTSTISGEGKSFVAINVAMSLALTKKKIVLVGLDIRSPMLSSYMNLPSNNGVTMFISDESMKLNEIIKPSSVHPFLDVILSGPIPPNPGELLMNSRLDTMFEQLRTMYDYIIVDSAPIGLVSDTYLLNRFVDNSIYVTRQNYTPKDACGLINEILDTNKLNNMAVVLNGTDESSGFGYGYGYGAVQKSKKTFSDRLKSKSKFRNK